ncbi:MAG TPA: cytochrome P450 [Jatrophihabitans sp.]|nr:cytochrome P450 [Jatrophihabitans sp.]
MTASTATPTTLPPPPQPRLPAGLPIPVAVQSMLFARYRHRWLPYLRRRHGATVLLRIAPHARRLVLLGRPEDIRTVFTGSASTFHAGEGNAILGPIMGQHSVLLLDEAEHLRIRKLLLPAFHGAPLRGYAEEIETLAAAEIERWPVGGQLASHRRMQALTLEIILQVVFGVTDQRRLAELRPIVERAVNVSPLIMLGWFYPRLRTLRPWRRFLEIQRNLDRLLYAEIAERRQAPDLADRRDVLSQLLRLNSEAAGGTADPDRSAGAAGLTDAELRDNLITLLLAGHETTATALAWTLHELARDREQLLAAQRAADAGDTGYLEAVFKESLRLHPIIYEVARRITEPIEVGGYRIPAGATVMPAIGLVQSDDRHHPEPERFDPGRFVDGQPAANTWIPFGGGARRCLGAAFSQLEATIVLRQLLTRFEVAADQHSAERPKARNITLAPSRGAVVRLLPRDR